MLSRHSQPLTLVVAGLDGLLAGASFFVAYLLRFHTELFGPGSSHPEDYALAAPIVVLTSLFAFYLAGLYETEVGSERPKEQLGLCLRGAALAALLVLALSGIYRRASYSRLLLAVYFGLLAAGLPWTRWLGRALLAFVRGRGAARHRALVVGEGAVAHALVESLRTRPWAGVEVIGTVAVNGGDDQVEADALPEIGKLEDLAELVTEHRIEEVFVALAWKHAARLPEIEQALRQASADLHVALDPQAFMHIRPRAGMLDDLQVLTIRGGPGYGWNRLAKRAVDLLGASVGLLLFAPVMAVVTVLIRRSSPGPILYRQTRVGWGGKPFSMLKFRTMREDAERGGARFTEAEDPRVTRIGRILRRTSLDELPQFWNIWKGEMSLVGPRPERPEHLPRIQEAVPHYPLRLSVKAGLTGWAQINGQRQNLSFDQRIQLDLYYVRNWSLWLDLWIIVQTALGGFLRNAQ